MVTKYSTIGYFLVESHISDMKREDSKFVKNMRFAVYVAKWELLADSNVVRALTVTKTAKRR